MEGSALARISERVVPTLKSIQDAAFDKFSKYDMECVNQEEFLRDLNEFHIAATLNYAVYSNLVC